MRELPPNLYRDTRRREDHWRYRRPDGTFKTFKATKDKAIALAIEANAKRDRMPAHVPASQQLELWVGRYIEYREQLDPSLIGRQSWKNRCASLRQFAGQFSGVSGRSITLQLLRPWWDGLTAHSQRSRRPELNKFFNFLMVEGVVSLQANPFSTSDDRPRVFTKGMPKRQRQRLSLDQYRRILAVAPPFLRIAMQISLYTTMRRGDIVVLRFDQHVAGGYLQKQISKSHAMGHGANLRWKLADHPALAATIAEARELALRHYACPYLLSREPARRRAGASKTHYAQVSPKMVSDAFHDAAAACGIEGVTFHEVRALSAFLYGKTHDIKTVQALMAHTSEKMTRHYQSGQEIEWLDIAIKLESNQ